METQLRQSSQTYFLNWTNCIHSTPRIFFLLYSTNPSPYFHLLRCCDATRRHSRDVTKTYDVTTTVWSRRSPTYFYCDGTELGARVFSQWVWGNELVVSTFEVPYLRLNYNWVVGEIAIFSPLPRQFTLVGRGTMASRLLTTRHCYRRTHVTPYDVAHLGRCRGTRPRTVPYTSLDFGKWLGFWLLTPAT